MTPVLLGMIFALVTKFCRCRLLLLHPKSRSDSASGTVLVSGNPVELHPAFGSDLPPIHLFNDAEVPTF